MGQVLNSIALNRESIRRSRCQHRENIVSHKKSKFDPSISLVIHWDGKMLSALTKMEHVDCFAVLVSVNGIFKFLGVPPLLKGTDKILADNSLQSY